MRVYALDQPDGLTEAMVAAGTIGEAAERLGTSVRIMRKLGWRAVKGPAARLAVEAEGRPLYRARLGASPGRWVPDRAQALALAARRALKDES